MMIPGDDGDGDGDGVVLVVLLPCVLCDVPVAVAGLLCLPCLGGVG